jgi:hypothetical protein
MSEHFPDRRREARAAVSLEVEVRGGERHARLTTTDVSPHGVFLATPEPWPLHARVEVDLPLPEGALTFVATVVRTRRPELLREGETPGMGLQFEAMSAAEAERWAEFCAAQARAAERRGHDRRPARLRVAVRAETAADLVAFWTRNVSPGGALFETDAPFEPGQPLELVFTHPESGARVTLAGRVVRREGPRVAVAFDAPDVLAFRRLIGV